MCNVHNIYYIFSFFENPYDKYYDLPDNPKQLIKIIIIIT